MGGILRRVHDYFLLRKQGFKFAWSMAEMSSFVKDFIRYTISFKMLLILTTFGIYHYYDSMSKDDEVARMFREKFQNEQVILSILNHKGLYIDDEMYTCKMENTRFKKDDFTWGLK